MNFWATIENNNLKLRDELEASYELSVSNLYKCLGESFCVLDYHCQNSNLTQLALLELDNNLPTPCF
jgi:hypothetical protein